MSQTIRDLSHRTGFGYADVHDAFALLTAQGCSSDKAAEIIAFLADEGVPGAYWFVVGLSSLGARW